MLGKQCNALNPEKVITTLYGRRNTKDVKLTTRKALCPSTAASQCLGACGILKHRDN